MQTLKPNEEVKFTDGTMNLEGDIWVARSEKISEKRIESKTTSIKYLLGGGAEVNETTLVKETDQSGKWVEKGKIVKNMHFDAAGKLNWGEVEFYFGSWNYPIKIDVGEENNRIKNSLPNLREPDFDVKTLEWPPNRSGFTTTIGGFSGAVYSVFMLENGLVRRMERTLINFRENCDEIDSKTGEKTVDITSYKHYDENDRFKSFSATAVNDVSENCKLDIQFNLHDDEDAYNKFLSQGAVDAWRKEMEMKKRNL